MSIMICIIILQLKNLGIIQSVIKSIGSGATSIEAIVSATEGLSLANTAAILTTTGLSEADKIAILMTRGLTEEEAKEALAAATLSTSTGVLATIQGKAATTTAGFKNALSGLGAVIKANPLLLIVTATTLVIAGLNKIKQSIDETAEELRTKTAESADTLTESLSNLGDYQKRIEELKDAINSDDISQSEATEKRKQLLEIQEELIKKYGKEKEAIDYITESIQGETSALGNLQTIAAQNYLNNNIKQIEEANNYLTKSYEKNAPLPAAGFGEENKSVIDKYKRYTDLIFSQIAPMSEPLYSYPEINKINGLSFKGTYSELLSQYDETLSNIRKYLSDNPINGNSSDEEKWQAEKLKELESYISNLRSRIDNDEELQKYQKIYNTALDSVLLTSNTYSEYYNKLIEAKSKYTEALASGNQEEITKTYTDLQNLLNEIFSLDFIDEDNVSGESIKGWFENVKQQIELQSKETPIIIDVQRELDSSSGSANKIKEIATKNNYTRADIDAIISKGDLPGQTLSADEQTVYDSVKGYVDLWNSVAEATGRSEIEVKEYIDILEKLGIVQKTVAEGSESSFALSKDQTKELKSVHSDVDKLNKAYQNLFSGKLTTNDVVELVDLFPTLGEYVDWTDEKFGNLAEGIDKVIKERPQELISQLEEVLNTQDLSDEAKKSIQSMIAALKQLKPELKDTKTLIEDIQKAVKGVSSSISTLIGFTKEISENGSLSLSSIDTIMTDDTYQSLRPYINDMEGMKTAITELTNKQKDAYEDLYNAEMYEKDYEAYHKAVQQKEQENENLLSDSIKQIEDEIKYFNDAYGIDITNWDNLTDTKKNILQNTNGELLSKQNKLINDFANSYGVDLRNFAKAADAKQAVLENLEKSKAAQDVRDYLNEHTELGADWAAHTPSSAIPKSVQEEVSKLLSGVMSFEDWQDWQRNGTLSEKAGNAIQKSVEEIIKGFTIDSTDWEKMTANIKSTGSSGSSSSGSPSSSKNYIDWIERRLKKFAQTTKEVFAKVADYISFNGQNSQLRKAIDAIRDEIAVNEQSYQFYMEEANNVGLDPYWQWFVQNGARNISDIQDEVLREKISRYKELYDQAIDCKNAVDDLRKTEKEYAIQMLSNVEKYYSNRIAYANADAEYYNSLDTETQNFTKNYAEIRKSYNNQIAETENKSRELLNTLNNLVSSGSIKYQSDEWYEWIDKINQCNVEVRNLKKTLHSLYAEELQDIKDFWENRVSNLDNTISYINTSSGDNTQNIAKNYKEIKNAYSKQISYTNKEIVELQNKLNESVRSGDIQEYSDKWYEWVNIINQAKEKVIELKKNIHQLAVEELQDIKSYWENKSGVSENAVSYINTVSSDTTRKNNNNYKSLSTEYNNQLIYATNEVVMLQKRLNDAIKSGDIQKYSDDWYEWTNSIEQAKEKIIELRKNIHLLAVKEFEDIKTKYNNLISFISNKESLLNESINQTKAQGYIVSTKYYEALIQNERNNISNLSAKRNELYSSLQKAVKSGDIEEGSEEWHKMVEEINNVDLEIKKANTSLIEFNNSIREIQWQVFDLLQNKISQITKESDFLINLMKNDNLYVKEGQKAGQFTNEGLSTVGLHGVNYNVYMAQAGKYAEEILKIDKQLANDPYNQDLANRRKELLKLQQSMILSAEEEKQAIVNMVKEGINLELNALKKLIDKYNEALNSQKDLYDYQKKIKDQTKELTSLQKQLSAYAGDTSEETKAKIQKLQVSISEAKENLEETQYNQFISDHKKLLDNLYNEYEKVLNQRLDNVDGLISDMIANVNDNANTIKQTITEQSGSVGYNISSTMNDIWNNGTKPVLSEYNRNFINVSSNVITAINGLTNSINTMISKLDRAASSSNDVKTMTNEPTVGVNKDTPKVPDNSKNNNSNNNSSSNSGTNNNNSNNNSNNNLNNNSNNNNNKNNSNNKQGKKNNTKKRTDKENYGVALAIINGNYGWGSGDERKRKLEEKKFNYSKVQGIVNKLWDEGLVHSNAWIGKYYGIRELSPYHYKNFKLGTNRVNRNQLAWTQENNSLEAIIRPSDGAILTPLAREDMVLNSKATANIFDMANNPNKFIKESLFSNERFNKIPNINNTNNFSVSIDNVNFNLPNVKNYEEFFYAAQHDKRFEKMVQAMTVDKLFGGSSLKKFHI